jgi:hypothetical protein
MTMEQRFPKRRRQATSATHRGVKLKTKKCHSDDGKGLKTKLADFRSLYAVLRSRILQGGSNMTGTDCV